MGLRLLVTYIIMKKIYADLRNNMVVDYFNHKGVSSVVGFPCNSDIVDDALLLRQFNKINVRAMIYRPSDKFLVEALQSTHWKIGVFINTHCLDTSVVTSIFCAATNYRLYGDLHYWFIITNNLSKLVNIIDDRAFGVSTDFVIAQSSNTTEANRYELYDVYNPFKMRGGILNVTFLGDWSYKDNLNISLTRSKFDRRADLQGLLLKVIFFKRSYALEENDSLVYYLQDYKQAARDGRSKYGYHVLQHLSDLYNFKFVCSESLKWEPGDKLGPLARALANDTVDMAGTPLIVSVLRTYLLKFVHEDWPFRTCFIFRSPQRNNIKIQEILRPFAPSTWYLMGIFLVIGILTLAFALHHDDRDHTSSKLSDSFLMVIGALCQQCSGIETKRLFTRMTFFWIMIFSLLMYNYYSASVVSARLDEPITKINDSLNEFTKMKLKIASEWAVYLEYFLKQTDWETKQFYNNLWAKLPESERFMEPETGIKLVREGDFAYHLHPGVGYPMIEKTFDNREICELMEVHLARPTYTGFAVTMNSSIVEIMRVGLVKISEVGIRYRHLKRWQYSKPKCRKDILSAASITIDEFSPHLILLLIGMVFSFAVYVIEIIIIKYENYKELSLREIST